MTSARARRPLRRRVGPLRRRGVRLDACRGRHVRDAAAGELVPEPRRHRHLGGAFADVRRLALAARPHPGQRTAGAGLLLVGRGRAAYLPFALNVMSFRGDRISDVTAFIVRSTEATDPEVYQRFPDQPLDARRLEGTFERFGLPDRLD